MTELSPDALRIIEQTRHQGSPSVQDRVRIRAAIDGAISSTANLPDSAQSSPVLAKMTLKKALWIAGIVSSIVIGVVLVEGRDPAREKGAEENVPLSLGAPPQKATSVIAAKQTPVSDGDGPGAPWAESLGASNHPESLKEIVAKKEQRTEQKNQRSRRRPAYSRNDTRGPEKSASLDEELRLLGAAQRARKQGDFQTALKLLREHRVRFRGGELSAEREAATALTLCDASMPQKARRVAKRFLRRYPKSPLSYSVRQSCAFAEEKMENTSRNGQSPATN